MGGPHEAAQSQKSFDYDFGAWCRALERHPLPFKARELMKVLKGFDQGTGQCWPANATVTKRCSKAGLWSSINTTKTWLRFLQVHGFITRQSQARYNGSGTSNLIVIHDQRIFGEPSSIPYIKRRRGGCQLLTPGVSNFGGGCQCLPPKEHPFFEHS